MTNKTRLLEGRKEAMAAEDRAEARAVAKFVADLRHLHTGTFDSEEFDRLRSWADLRHLLKERGLR